MRTCKDNIENWIKILKASNIDGCITGSCLLDKDFDLWDSKPDVDIFVYSDRYMIYAISNLMLRYGLKLGCDDTDRSRMQEEQKLQWLFDDKKNKSKVIGITLATIKLHADDGTIINVSCKSGCKTVADVVNSFDMTIIMKGWDILGEFQYDMTDQWGDPCVAIPNKLRKTDLDMVKTAYWIRQFDRVIKYWQRGFDTRPMARFYIAEIDKVLKRGNIWTSDSSKEFYQEFAKEFIETREKISKWLADKEE